MTTEYGVTASGFVPKTRSVVLSELQDAAITQYGPGTDVSSDSVLGIELGLMADVLAAVWDQAYLAYSQAYPDGATGDSFAALARLTACDRLPPSHSLIDVVFTGTNGTVIPIGTVVSAGPGTHSAATTVVATVVGTSVSARVTSTETGPLQFYAGYITTINTPVAGLSSVSQSLDAVFVGSDLESEVAWRSRRETSLRAIGGASVDGIRSRVLAVAPAGSVSDCYVYNNDDDAVDGDGLPGHSFEVVAAHTDDSASQQQAIADAILAAKPAGIRSHGLRTLTARDTGGATRTVRYTRPYDLEIYVNAAVKTDGTEPSVAAVVNAVKAAIVASETSYRPGNNVVASRLESLVLRVDDYMYDVTILLGITPIPTGREIVLSRREQASFDSSRIVVSVTHASDT